jgi:4-hydroxy-tetrahydrodipicolinate reductase
MHHKHKVDAPSGTALALGEAAARVPGARSPIAPSTRARVIRASASPMPIGFATLRGGDVVGEHTVIFAGTGERVELAHKATSRQNFARGALARRALRRRAPRRGQAGLADMRDVLGLR